MGIVNHDFCNLEHMFEPFASPDFISVPYVHNIPFLLISHGPELLYQILICTESIHFKLHPWNSQ